MNRRRRKLLQGVGATSAAVLGGCLRFISGGTETASPTEENPETPESTAGAADSQPEPTDATATQSEPTTASATTTADGGGTANRITSTPAEIVDAIATTDSGIEIALGSIYDDGAEYESGTGDLRISGLGEFSLYAIYEGNRDPKTYYDAEADERKMRVAPTFSDQGVIEGILLPRPVERNGSSLTELTVLVDGQFHEFAEEPLRIAGGSGPVEEWSVIGKLPLELVSEDGARVYAKTAYLEVLPDDFYGAIVGTFTESDLQKDRYYKNVQVGIDLTA